MNNTFNTLFRSAGGTGAVSAPILKEYLRSMRECERTKKLTAWKASCQLG
jgi:hypothetical protein